MSRNNKNISMAINLGAAISAAIVIISMFMNYIKLSALGVTSSITGFNLFKSDNATTKLFLTIVLILAIAVTAHGILRILNIFNGKLSSIIFAVLGVALIICSIILFIVVTKEKVLGETVNIYDRTVGMILNLIFSILAGLCCIGSFVIRSK